MTDFVSSEGQFKSWAGPKHCSRRKKFIDRAIACISKHAKRGFVSTMVIADFDFVNSRYEAKENYGPPLTICGMGVIGQVGRWARGHGFNVQPVVKSECCIFEACDMAAWKYSAGMRDAENKKGTFEDITASLEPTARIVQHDVAVDKRKFLEHCISIGYPRKKRIQGTRYHEAW